MVELETQVLVDELTADLQREVDDYNVIVQKVDEAKQQVALSEQDLLVRRGRIDQIQRTLQRLNPPEKLVDKDEETKESDPA